MEQLTEKCPIDLFFLDIQIPGEISGIALAKEIRARRMDAAIVFCTNYSEYVYDGYAVNAMRFLKKPIQDEDVFFCCNHVYDNLPFRTTDNLIFFSEGKRCILRHTEVLYIESRGHTVYIASTVFPELLKIKTPLGDVSRDLPPELFIPCHRSFLVNVMHIRSVARTSCQLSNHGCIPISRTYAKAVSQAFDRYHEGSTIRFGLDCL